MNQTIAEMYDKTFSGELKDLVQESLFALEKLEIYQATPPEWTKIDDDKEPLYKYIKILVRLDVYKAVPLLIRLFADLERNVPFDASTPENQRNQESFFRVVIQVDVDGVPLTYKCSTGDKTTTTLYYYSPKHYEEGLQFYQPRFRLTKSIISEVARKMIPVARYHKSHDTFESEATPVPQTTKKSSSSLPTKA